jgi:hypothetical protein
MSTFGNFKARLGALWGLSCALSISSAAAQDLTLYDDALRNGWQNFSYGGGSNFANASPTQAGNASIALTGNNFNAVSLAHETQAFASSAYPTLRFFVHGGSAGGQQLRVFLQLNNAIVANAELDAYIVGGSPLANGWREVLVRFANPPLAYSGSFDRIDLQSDQAAVQPVLYLDEFRLLAPSNDVIFANGFEPSVTPPLTGALQIERDVVVDNMTSDRFSWRDGANQPRVAVLAHNTGQSGPGGTRGGELRRFEYSVPGGTRVVRAAPTFASGFGYVVSHREEGTSGIPGDDSPLGHGFTGSFSRVFEGRHHAIFRFTQLYPRYSRTTATPPNTLYNVPVTIDWSFATGRDHPLWSLTWDLSGVPANALSDDSRAPYGELLFDGAASAAAHSVLAGVGWGDRFKFASTSNPVSYNSAWTWNVANTIPYVKLWTTAVDATMGTVQTQTIVQQDAGGYFGANRWNTTSAAGNACTVAIGGTNSLMPCPFNWPYQSVNYSLDAFGNPNSNTNNTRLAWGTNFGFLGRTAYPIHGSDFYGGPLVGDPRASGWPRKSYSTFVVFGLHSDAPVEAQVAQIETVQTVALTAAIGSVAISGPAGAGRIDTMNYQPSGWNPVYAAWALTASGNAVDANFAVPGGRSLRKPVLIVSNWTSAALPSALRFNGATQAVDADWLPSLRPSANELWITLNRDLNGATNRVEIVP